MSRAMDTFPSVHSIDSARRASRRATRSTPRSAEGRSRSESNAADTPPPEADATSAHPPAVFSDVVMNRTSARAPNRARAGGAGRVGSRDAVIGRRSGVLGDALSPMPTGGVAGGVGDGTWEVSRTSSEMNDTHDWKDVSESKEACGDDDDDGTCRRLNACLSPGGGAGFVGIGYGSGRAGIETPQPMCLRICGRAKTLTKTRARFRLMIHKSSQVPGCAKASPADHSRSSNVLLNRPEPRAELL